MSPGSGTTARILHAALPLALAAALLAPLSPAGAVLVPPDPTVVHQDETGKVGFIGAPPGRPIRSGAAPGTPAATVATRFLRENAARLGLAGPKTELRVTEQHRTAQGQVVRMAQVHDGIPVLAGAFTVNLDQFSDILSVLGEASPIGSVSSTPAITARQARRTAARAVGRAEQVSTSALRTSRPTLMYYDPRLLGADGPFQTARLAWVVDDVASPRRGVAHTVVVDAATGSVALDFSTIAHARDRIVCDANNTSTQLPCVSPVWTESAQPAGADADVAAAFEYTGDTYDFFADRFGRDSLDDAGMQLVTTVDYCQPGEPCPYANAFWDGSQMVYGDGFAAADDVVGHELAHGFTDFTSHLFYYMQSGAINESLSDIFGELIDQTNAGGDDSAGVRWLMGEDVPVFGAIRNMANPGAFGDPDRMRSPQYYGGPQDGGGVHSNSGVSNKAAYLLVDGGTFNGRTVGALGLTKTARLFYTVNNDLLVSGSDFADLANALRQACANLAGAGTDGFATADCTAVDNAVLATEMDLNPTNGPTSVVAPCSTGAPSYAYRDDLETPAGQFTTVTIAGAEVWSYPQNPNGIFDATYATSGDTNIWGYNGEQTSDSALRMSNAVTIPADAFLHFKHAYGFENDPGGTWDGGVVEYSTTGAGGPWTDAANLFAAAGGAGGYTGTINNTFGNPLGGRAAFVGDSQGYGASRADLATLAGESVMFRWRIGTDSTIDDYGWFIDDVSIFQCVLADSTPPATTITSGPAEGSIITIPSATFAFAADETSTFACRLATTGYTPCTSPLTLTALTEGPHTFSVVATDTAGNTDPTPATRTFTVALADSTPPITTITSGPADGATITTPGTSFGFTASEAGSSFACQLDSGPAAACVSPAPLTGLTEGSHTFSVVATDPAGNTDPTPATRTFIVALPDTTPPQTRITKHPKKRTTRRVAVFVAKAVDVSAVTFQCRLDRKGWRDCTARTKYRVKRGGHTFRVRAIDAAGNIDPTPAVWKWKVKRKR